MKTIYSERKQGTLLDRDENLKILVGLNDNILL